MSNVATPQSLWPQVWSCLCSWGGCPLKARKRIQKGHFLQVALSKTFGGLGMLNLMTN